MSRTPVIDYWKVPADAIWCIGQHTHQEMQRLERLARLGAYRKVRSNWAGISPLKMVFVPETEPYRAYQRECAATLNRYRRKARAEARRPSASTVPYSKDKWEQTAADYARWLAERDGVVIPIEHEGRRLQARAVWGSVDTGRKRKRHPRWAGDPSCELSLPEKRIRAVEWGCMRSKPSERAYYSGGRWKRGYVDVWHTVLTIEIPNWDHVPVVVEGLAS